MRYAKIKAGSIYRKKLSSFEIRMLLLMEENRRLISRALLVIGKYSLAFSLNSTYKPPLILINYYIYRPFMHMLNLTAGYH